MHQWLKIFSTNKYPQASIVQGLLEENHIPVQVLNKQDSSYQSFGEIELYVPFHLKEVAIGLMDDVLRN
jgi:hypothetical protein